MTWRRAVVLLRGVSLANSCLSSVLWGMCRLKDRAEGADEALYALDHITPDYGG
jgi:hypothetical protein